MPDRPLRPITRTTAIGGGLFAIPTLDELTRVAYNQNLTLLSAGTRVLQARAVLGIAIGEFYPQVQEGTGSLIYNRTSGAVGPLKPRQFWTDALAGQAAWELDFWGKFRRGIEFGRWRLSRFVADYDQVLVTLLGDVAATYTGIRTTEDLIAIARDNVQKQKDALNIAKAKYKGGSTSERDVFQATSVLEATESAIPQLTIQLEQGRNALCVLLGIPPQSLSSQLAHSTARIPVPPTTIAVGIPADLLRRRPDIRAAELAALAQSAQIGVAKSELYPAISISGTFGATACTANGHNLGQIFTHTAVAYAAGPSFQWNILNYGQITNNVRLQDTKLQQLLVDYQRRPQGATGSGRRDLDFCSVATPGRVPWSEHRCGEERTESIPGAVSGRRDRLHHRAHKPSRIYSSLKAIGLWPGPTCRSAQSRFTARSAAAGRSAKTATS